MTTISRAQTLLSGFEAFDSEIINEECGADVNPMVAAVQTLMQSLGVIVSQVRRVLLLTSCYKVSPVRKRIFEGATCNESVNGITWMFSTLLAICILALTMLSVRAALYNAVLRPARNKDDKEWEEYKEYMAQYFDDADDWTKNPSPRKMRKDDPISGPVGSFDTDFTAKSSTDSEDMLSSPESNRQACYFSSSEKETWHDEEEVSMSTPYATPMRLCVDHERLGDFSVRSRNLLHVLDEEILPLSPQFTPQAPKKAISRLRRTNRGKLC